MDHQYDKSESKSIDGTILHRVCTQYSLWDSTAIPATLPPGLTLILGDVSGGSNTPSMVRLVLEWKKNKQLEAERVWNELSSLNNNVERLLRTLSFLASSKPQTYRRTLRACAQVTASQVSSISLRRSLVHSCVRALDGVLRKLHFE